MRKVEEISDIIERTSLWAGPVGEILLHITRKLEKTFFFLFFKYKSINWPHSLLLFLGAWPYHKMQNGADFVCPPPGGWDVILQLKMSSRCLLSQPLKVQQRSLHSSPSLKHLKRIKTHFIEPFINEICFMSLPQNIYSMTFFSLLIFFFFLMDVYRSRDRSEEQTEI